MAKYCVQLRQLPSYGVRCAATGAAADLRGL